MLNTARIALVCAFFQTLICAIIGYGFAKFKFKFKKILFICVIFTMVVPHETIQLSMFMKFRSFDIWGIVNGLGNMFNNLGTMFSHPEGMSAGYSQLQQGLADAIFNVNIPKPAAEQKKSFEALLTTALDEECSLEVVQTVHDQLCQCIQMHKESRVPDPLLISKEQVKTALTSCGISENRVSKFSVEFDEAFGSDAELHPKNIINDKRFEIKTPDVSIKVAPDRVDLIETRVIGGVKYILICADENVEVNGVNIHIKNEE